MSKDEMIWEMRNAGFISRDEVLWLNENHVNLTKEMYADFERGHAKEPYSEKYSPCGWATEGELKAHFGIE